MKQAALRKPEPVLETLRAQCARVMAQADHVHVHADKIAEYARFVLDTYPVITEHDEHHYVSKDAEKTAAYIIALDSINFGSGYFRAADIEYRDIAGGLKRAFERGELDTAEKWAKAGAGDFYALLDRPRSPVLDELVALFVKHLSATGRNMMADYGGRALNLLEAAGHSAATLVDILATWPEFRDISTYKGQGVPFLKRAQIMAAHLELTGIPQFTDMDALTIFADNMLPHVLRCDGILEYAPALAEKIDGGVYITPGSAEETELRAAAIHAVELMKIAAHAQGRNVTSTNIDHILWNRGYTAPAIHARKPHQTKTVWY